MEPILVTGGTGTLGRHVVRRLRDTGRDVRVLTRSTHADAEGVRFVTGDLLSGAGVDAAVDGAATIVHCAGGHSGDEATTRTLLEAIARGGGRPHLVYISVVGAERVPVGGPIDRLLFGYFDMKRKAEQMVRESGLPWTTLRAAQFYDLVLQIVEALAKLPIAPVPAGLALQPVDADEVAARLVELTLGPPSGLVPEMAGPRVYDTAELLRGYLAATHRHRLVVPIPLPGRAARAVRDGAATAHAGLTGTRTWESFLAARVRPTHTRRPVSVGGPVNAGPARS